MGATAQSVTPERSDAPSAAQAGSAEETEAELAALESATLLETPAGVVETQSDGARGVSVALPEAAALPAPAADDPWNEVRGLAFMSASALSFSLQSLFMHLVGARVGAFQVVLCRSTIIALSSAALLWHEGRALYPRDEPVRLKLLLFLRSVAGFVGVVSYTYAFIHLTLPEATAIVFTSPAMTAIIARVVLKERLSGGEWAAVFVTLCGLFMVAHPRFAFGAASDEAHAGRAPGSGDAAPVSGSDARARSDSGLGIAIAVLAAVFTAIVNVLVRSLKSLHPNLIVHNFAVITALLCIPAVPIVGEAVVHPRRLIWSDWLLLVGIGGTGFMGQMCITRGLQLEKAGLASMIRTLDVVLAFAMHLAFLHDEQLAWYTVVGSLLIVACSIYVAIRKFRQARARVRESSSARLGA